MSRIFLEDAVVAYLDNEDSPDISNPIHSTEVAKAYRFGGPLVGGVTVWGWAGELIIAVRIVTTHVGNILNKTGASNRAEAAVFATRNDLA